MTDMANFIIRNLVNEDGGAQISDYGAHVMSWAPTGAFPVLSTPDTVPFRKGEFIDGGIPVVFPWFNQGFERGRLTDRFPRHGFARTRFWRPAAGDASDQAGPDPTGPNRLSSGRRMRYTLDSADVPDDLLARCIGGFAPGSAFRAAYDVRAGHELAVTLTVRNTGSVPFTFEAALHTYLRVGDATRVRLEGLGNSAYLDATLPGFRDPGFPTRTQPRSPVVFTACGVDRVYYAGNGLLLRDDAWNRSIAIERTGATQTVVWNPGAERSEWQKFVCVESAAIRELAVTLEPGESHALGQTLRTLRTPCGC